MSLQAIFEALKYMWQLQGLRVQTTCKGSERFLEENRTAMCSHPKTFLHMHPFHYSEEKQRHSIERWTERKATNQTLHTATATGAK